MTRGTHRPERDGGAGRRPLRSGLICVVRAAESTSYARPGIAQDVISSEEYEGEGEAEQPPE